MAPSKNSRTLIPSSSKGINVDPKQRLIIPLNGGKSAYVFDVTTGANIRTETGSEQFWVVVEANTEAGHGKRIVDELTRLGTTRPVFAHAADEYVTRSSEKGNHGE
jgi:hypothetical protein